MAYMKDSTGRRLDSFPVASSTKVRAAALLAKVGAIRTPIPAITTDVPTVTHATSTALAGTRRTSALSPQVTRLGATGTWNASFGRLDVGGVSALGFFIDAADFEIAWYNGTNPNYLWIWVDGQPMTSAPVSTALTSSTNYFTRITFGAARRRRIEFWIQGAGYLGINSAPGVVVEPLPVAPAVAFVGDSFYAGSDTTFTPSQLTAACIMGRALGVDFHVRAVGGTGYLAEFPTSAANQFGTRVPSIAAIPNLELIIIDGSVNDPVSGLQAAATAMYSALDTACPGVPVIVFGVQPSNDVDTISGTTAQKVAALKAAANAAPNVIAFIDQIGSESGSAPAAWSSGKTYATGELVTYQGSIWRASNGATAFSGAGSTPGTSGRWLLVTYLYTGTGRVGATAGDGTRDTVLYSDDLHPTSAGSYAMGMRKASEVVKVLGTFATT